MAAPLAIILPSGRVARLVAFGGVPLATAVDGRVFAFDPNQPRDEIGRWVEGFHGTAIQNVKAILRDGLRPSPDGTVWAARDVRYALQYAKISTDIIAGNVDGRVGKAVLAVAVIRADSASVKMSDKHVRVTGWVAPEDILRIDLYRYSEASAKDPKPFRSIGSKQHSSEDVVFVAIPADALRNEKQYAQHPIAYEHIGRALDALELKAKAELSAELRRVRSDLTQRLKTAKSPRAFKTLPRRSELEAEVLAMLTRAQEAGREAMRDELPKEYAAEAFTPRAAVKWLKDAAFWVTDLLSDDLLSEAQSILVKGLKNGTATSVMMAELWEAFVPYLGGDVGEKVVTAHRLETIVRTNTTTAYNHGRLTTLLDPDLAPFTYGVRYSAILDTRTTEVCRFLDGRVFLLPAGVKKFGGHDQTEAVEALLPPRHFNCRSIVVPVIVGSRIEQDEVITEAEIARAKELSGEGFMQRGAFRNYGGDSGATLLSARVALLKARMALGDMK